MCFETFLYLIWYSHDHSDGLGDGSPRFQYVSENCCCMGGISNYFSHFLLLVPEFSHCCKICDDELSFDHVIILVFGVYDADLTWVHGFKLSDNDVPGGFSLIGINLLLFGVLGRYKVRSGCKQSCFYCSTHQLTM